MWHLMTKGKGLLFLVSLASAPCLAAEASVKNESLQTTAPRKPNTNSWNLSPSLGLGLGSFTSVAVGANVNNSTESAFATEDTPSSTPVVAEQSGVPLMMGISLNYLPNRQWGFNTDFNFMRMSSISPQTAGQQGAAGYMRFNLFEGIAYHLPLPVTLNSKLGARRDIFTDGSLTHVADAFCIAGGPAIKFWGNEISAEYGHSLMTKLAFSDRQVFGAQSIEGASATLDWWKAGLSRRFSKSTNVGVSYEQEYWLWNYPTYAAYAGYGLAGNAAQDEMRSLVLETNVLSLVLTSML